MKKNAIKWMVLGGVLVFIVLYAMEMSQTGIERIYGPIEGGRPTAVAGNGSLEEDYTEPEAEPAYGKGGAPLSDEAERKIARLEKELAEVRKLAELNSQKERLPGIKTGDGKPTVNKLADETAGLLQSVSSGSIKFVVSLFGSVAN
ncbi:hypothetical protein [Paenibacillus sp. NPDC058071]|uniref:hypothetical protein n=1 Tax=Paenibacillus sp. NPDC058071 TaxID=3346326 RepID=UPI0036DC1697